MTADDVIKVFDHVVWVGVVIFTVAAMLGLFDRRD